MASAGWGLRHRNTMAWKIYMDGILETSGRNLTGGQTIPGHENNGSLEILYG